MRMRVLLPLTCLPILIIAYIDASLVPALPEVPTTYKSTYGRTQEVLQQCGDYLTELLPFNHDQSKEQQIRHGLSLFYGGWQQVSGKAPLIPFITASSISYPGNPEEGTGPQQQEEAHLASLHVTDVGSRTSDSSIEMVNVSAVLQIAIAARGSYMLMSNNSKDLTILPGLSLVNVFMEGVYAEQQNKRVLCLLGSAKLPRRAMNTSFPWDWLDLVEQTGYIIPSVDDSKIMAVFHFPRIMSLTSRAVSGRLMSFHSPANTNYFNPVDISSQLGAHSKYEFVAGDLIESACSKPVHLPGEVSEPQKTYRGSGFCRMVYDVLSNQRMEVLPNWNCSLSKEICTKLGPFSTSSVTQPLDGGFHGIQLLVEDVGCVDYVDHHGSPSANLSAVFRAVLPSQDQDLAFERTDLDGLTLAVDGRWSNSSGQLCMVGCKGVSAGLETNDNIACDHKICLYFPLTFSLKQRSILLGSISSAHNISKYFYPLAFFLPLRSRHLLQNDIEKYVYEYSQIIEAGAMLERYEPVGFGEAIRKSVLKYPSATSNLMAFFDDLSFNTPAFATSELLNGLQSVSFDILAIEDRVSLGWWQLSEDTAVASSTAVDDETMKVVEQKNYYKLAGLLTIIDRSGNVFMRVSVEGEYDPMLGRMFLVGCREVNAPWKTFQESAELLENGLDCFIEISMKYPPSNARWLVNPTVMISITSKRTADDPLFFPTIKLQTFRVTYRTQKQELISRKSLEGGLTVFTLSFILVCVISELAYIKSHSDCTPYISLLMLAVQVVGFSIPLITDMEALFSRTSSDLEDQRETLFTQGKWTWVIGSAVKILSLAAFLSTLRIVQKVIKSRIRLSTQYPNEPRRVPSDKRVLAICTSIHGIGFIIVLVLQSVKLSRHTVLPSMYMDGSGNLDKQHQWKKVMQEYYGLVQDLFLLPQVVGYHLWEVKGKPLRKLFYIGITISRLLPHIYDQLRAPVFNPYFSEEYGYANPSSDFYSKAGDIALPLLAVLLAIIVYIQQRWNGWTLEALLQHGSDKLMHMGSKMYERVPSKTMETEMIESGSGT